MRNISIPTKNVEKFITNLALENHVVYKKTASDMLAETITRLSDDEVIQDSVELLILALEREGVIRNESVVPLHINYLREKLGV